MMPVNLLLLWLCRLSKKLGSLYRKGQAAVMPLMALFGFLTETFVKDSGRSGV